MTSLFEYHSVGRGCRMPQLHFCKGGKTPSSQQGSWYMTLNWIWWWGSCPGVLENLVYSFIVITLSSTLTQIGSTSEDPMGEIELFNHFLGIIIINNLIPLELFTSVLADGFSLEFGWQEVSSSLQDSSQYSGHPQQCCRLDSFQPSANFQVLQAL